MEEQIKCLDENLIITNRKDFENEIHIYCEKKYDNKRVHQRTLKKVQDIPFNGKKVILYLTVKRFKNEDKKIKNKTITESFDFLNETKRRTKRLDTLLYDLTEGQSFTAAAKYANKYIANISDDTLINLVLKKTKK